MGPSAVRESQVSERQEEASGEAMMERVSLEMRILGGREGRGYRRDSSRKCWGWREDA